jgi:small subunit ribosomal protein S17
MAEGIKKIGKIKGKVVSAKMEQTLVVAVESLKTHSKYLKKYRSTKKYKVHNPEKKYQEGDTVEFVQCKPVSKDKRHIVI